MNRSPCAGCSTTTGPDCPANWQDILTARSGLWALLDSDERTRLGVLAEDLLATKRWEAAHGFELTDEVRTVIAAHAALLALELDPASYDGVGTIVVRAGAMRRSAPMAGPVAGVVVGTSAPSTARRTTATGPSW